MKYSEKLELMQESEWTQGDYIDEASGKKCMVGFLGPVGLWNAMFEAGIAPSIGYAKLVRINDDAKNFLEAKSKGIKLLRSLGL